MKVRIFCDVVPFCLTDLNSSEDPAVTSVYYLKDETNTIKTVQFMIRVERA